ncbi:MAG: hypothetical protein Q4B01_05005 [Eubacteriales bacterium]|nr:hypothetical protein [Eubacteriales bacterium]
MKQIQDQALLSAKMRQYHFDEIFSSEGLPFMLCSYEKGEILNFRRQFSRRLVFLLDGSISIDSIRVDGSRYHVCTEEGLTLLGDIEFIQNREGDFLVEARSDLLCMELSTVNCKEQLQQDNAFLHFCLRSVVNKFEQILRTEAAAVSLEEKLLQYLKNSCRDSQLKGVQTAADQLHCSRRQLQRVLKKLCEQGKIEKAGKGEYRLK